MSREGAAGAKHRVFGAVHDALGGRKAAAAAARRRARRGPVGRWHWLLRFRVLLALIWLVGEFFAVASLARHALVGGAGAPPRSAPRARRAPSRPRSDAAVVTRLGVRLLAYLDFLAANDLRRAIVGLYVVTGVLTLVVLAWCAGAVANPLPRRARYLVAAFKRGGEAEYTRDSPTRIVGLTTGVGLVSLAAWAAMVAVPTDLPHTLLSLVAR